MKYPAVQCQAVKTYFAENFNSYLAAVAAELEETVDTVETFVQGFEDPLNLRKYNALLFIPDDVSYSRADRMFTVQMDIVSAVIGSTVEKVEKHQAIYADSIWGFTRENSRFGGIAVDAEIEKTDFFAPVPGNKLTGLVVSRLSISFDERE